MQIQDKDEMFVRKVITSLRDRAGSEEEDGSERVADYLKTIAHVLEAVVESGKQMDEKIARKKRSLK